MDSTLLSSQGTLKGSSETNSLASLLEHGIDCIRQGSYSEGAACFAIARERLTPDQMHCAVLLDAFLQSHTSYWEAQQSLHLASKRFAEADIEQLTRLATIEKLFSDLNEKTGQSTQSLLISQQYQLFGSQLPPHLTSQNSLSVYY